MLIIYFVNVSYQFSPNSDDWGNFGSYLGSITGVLAFIGVLYSIQLSEKRAAIAEARLREAATKADVVEIEAHSRYIRDCERNIFFQLLELHTNKVNAIEFNGKRGAEAFKDLADIANRGLILKYVYQYIIDKCCDLKKTELLDLYENNRDLFKVLEFAYQTFFVDNLYNSSLKHNIDFAYQHYQNLIEYIKKKEFRLYAIEKCKKNEDIIFHLEKHIDKFSIESRLNNIQEVADFIYREYGHILGHYFRNMYYVMDTIDKFYDKKNYKELFRAQLSRYELALGIFNAVSSNSSDRMIYLLKEFKIFKDTYPDDIAVLKILMNKNNYTGITNQDKMLAITNEILDSWK